MIDPVALAKEHRLLVTRKCKCGWTFTPDGRYWTDHHDEHLGEVIAAYVAEVKAEAVRAMHDEIQKEAATPNETWRFGQVVNQVERRLRDGIPNISPEHAARIQDRDRSTVRLPDVQPVWGANALRVPSLTEEQARSLRDISDVPPFTPPEGFVPLEDHTTPGGSGE